MKIICVGRNYREHAKELNNPVPDEPVIFMKPDTALLQRKQPFFLPSFSADIHHEVELVVKISRLGKNIEEKFAHKYYDEISVGIDFTARDIQNKCKTKSLPWELAKAFDGSAPVGKFVPKENLPDPGNLNFHLELNGTTVQKGNSKDQIFNFDNLISFVSGYFTLKIGDLIFTGTPAGVGPVKTGDNLKAFIEDKKLLELDIR